jgi:hypothetical protein
MNKDPFVSPKVLPRRMKLFVWGDYGSGKTPLLLSFPSPAIIDLEDGARFYGEDTPRFKGTDYKIFPGMPKNLDEFYAIITWLETNQHPYKTLGIDPITVYYKALCQKWTAIFHKQQQGRAGDKVDYYRLQGSDWPYIHEEFRIFVNRLLRLDMNIIATAHSKAKYKRGTNMIYDGETFDCGQKIAYMFDTVIQVTKEDTGQKIIRKGVCERDRTGRILEGQEFDLNYKMFEQFFGKESLEKEATPLS